MKRLVVVIVLMLLLSVVFLVMSGNGVSYQESGDMTVISPYSQGVSQLSKLYFIYEDQLITETRTIRIEKLETALSITNELKKGSQIEAYKSPISGDVDILFVKTSDRICYVSLSKRFFTDDSERLYLNMMSIVNTITELDTVDYVQILVDGKKINDPDLDVSKPLARNTSIVQNKELTHKDIVKKFLNHVSIGRYDLAYDMIDSKSKQFVSFDDFRQSMLLVRNEIKGYTQRYIFARRENGNYLIQVKYALIKYVNDDDLIIDSQRPMELIFSWPVIQEQGIWKIVYYDY